MAAKHPSEYPTYNGRDQAEFYRHELDWAIGVIKYTTERALDWADRHAQHAGHAPLSELRAILRGEDEEVHPVVPEA